VKEVMFIIRMEMVNKTKQALLLENFASLNCKKVLGRGKRKVDFSIFDNVLEKDNITSPKLAQTMLEVHRLIPKRLISIVVKDEDVKKVVDIVIRINKTGNPGDGKIFVLPIEDCIRVRTGERAEDAI
jgi:nitrogen regulatory protein PII 2